MENFQLIGFIDFMETLVKEQRERTRSCVDVCDSLEKYILVNWPEIQMFMEHPRWSECIFCTEIPGHPCDDSTYAVPESLYKEVYK